VRLTVTADFDGHLGPESGESQDETLDGTLARAAELSEEELMAGVHEELAFYICAPCRIALLEDPLAAGFLRRGGGMVQ